MVTQSHNIFLTERLKSLKSKEILKEDKTMIDIIKNDTHRVVAEKVQNRWWVDLIERSTGITQIIIFNNKESALSLFKGMTIKQIVKFFNEDMKVEKQKMYKKGLM